MEFRILISILIITAALTGRSFAGSGSHTATMDGDQHLAESAHIEDLIIAARDRNPSIASARAAWKASIENVRIDAALPDPQLSLTWFPAPIETRLGPQDWNIMLSQKIPFPKKLSTKKEIAIIRAAVAALKTDQVYRKVVASVKTAFYELGYIRNAKRIAGQNLDILNRFQKIAENAYAQDRTIFADVIKAQAQAGQVHYDLLLLSDLEQTQTTLLNGLLNRDPMAPIGILTGGMVFSELPGLDLLFQTAREKHEAVAMAGKAIQTAQRENALAKYAAYPDFRLGATWVGIGSPDVASPPPDAGDDAFGIQFGISIPLWSGKNRGRVLKAQSRIKEQQAAQEEILNQVQTDIRILYYKTRNAFRQTTLYEKDLLPQAIRALEISETWFREGEGTVADILESQSAVYNFQLSLARARADMGKHMAQLERLIGGPVSGLNTRGGSQ